MATFALLINDEFDISALSYDWATIVTVTAREQIAFDLWNEDRFGFSWESDTERLATMLSWKLQDAGYDVPLDDPTLIKHLRKLCVPGPGRDHHCQMTFTAVSTK